MDPETETERDEALRRAIRDVRRVKLAHIALVLLACAVLALAVLLG